MEGEHPNDLKFVTLEKFSNADSSMYLYAGKASSTDVMVTRTSPFLDLAINKILDSCFIVADSDRESLIAEQYFLVVLFYVSYSEFTDNIASEV